GARSSGRQRRSSTSGPVDRGVPGRTVWHVALAPAVRRARGDTVDRSALRDRRCLRLQGRHRHHGTGRLIDRVDGKIFDELFERLRPKLHRYCARMTGSVIDGEDVVQEALVKALEALPAAGTLANPEGWLFRIAHNAALDFLRRRARQEATFADDEDLELIAGPTDPDRDAVATVASLRTCMRL